MYSVLQRRPTVRDAKIRWHNGYAHEYGVNETSSAKYLELRDKFAYKGVPLSVEYVARIKESMKVGDGERPLEFFEKTLGKLLLREGIKGSHWTKVRETLPKHMQQCIPRKTDCEDDGSASDRTGEDDVQEGPSEEEPDEGPSEEEPDEAPSAEGLAAAAGHAASQQLSGRSKYTVPSQIHEVDGVIDLTAEEVEGLNMPAVRGGDDVEGCEFDSESTSSLCAKNSKRDAYQDFMPMYQQMCKSASAPGVLGEKCYEIMKEEMKNMRRKVFGASVNVDKDSACVDCTSYPVISSKKVARRKKMVTSPDKRGGKRRRK